MKNLHILPFEGAGTRVHVKFEANDDSSSNNDNTIPRFILGYWSIRGLCAPLRMMLCAAEVPFVSALYDGVETDGDGDGLPPPLNAGEGWDFSGWHSDKALLKSKYNPFVNFPFVVDGGNTSKDNVVVVTQSNACYAHVAREIGMWGNNDVEVALCEELLCETADLRNLMVFFCYVGPKDQDAIKTGGEQLMGAVTHPDGIFKKVEIHLDNEKEKSGKQPVHLISGRLTAPDFHMWELLDQFEICARCCDLPSPLDNFPNVKAYKEGFAQLSENQSYLKSSLYQGLPINNVMARFGSTPDADDITKTIYQPGQSAPWKGRGDVVEIL